MISFETETEGLLRDELRKNNYYDNRYITIEEKHSKNPSIDKLLKKASKTGGPGKGQPEFIITHTKYRDFIIVNECKADISKHESKNRDKYVGYAVDGVLNYALHLSKEYNVIAIASSGNKDNHKISTFLWAKGCGTYSDLTDKYKNPISYILSFDEYVKCTKYDDSRVMKTRKELKGYAKELHNYMRDRGKLGEAEKPLLVSGILLALTDITFKKSYSADPKQLQTILCDAIERVIKNATMPYVRKENMNGSYSFIKTHDDLVKEKNGEVPLLVMIKGINEHFLEMDDFDSIGEFYKEFLRYTGGDKRGLGIVLTPHHITELFADIAGVTKNNIVLDICAGTAGFLISSMYKMFMGANDEEKENIKENGLIGVEQKINMFTLASSNMLLRGDGKANLYRGDCFDKEIIEQIRNRADIGMMNPPYSQKEDNLHEFNFIETLLDCLKINGKAVVIVPMSCAISPHKLKEKILKKHRLDAVMSMPDQLFSGIAGTITCVMVFTAHTPHSKDHKTWFGYCKDDGFKVMKHRGRLDINDRWKNVKKYWVDSYRNKSVIPGFSVLRHVNAKDEWCAEAYMETDYSNIKQEDFIKEIKKYVLFRELGETS